MRRFYLIFFLSFLLAYCPLLRGGQTFEFYKQGIYQENIPEPEEVIGFPIGEKPVRYPEAVRYMESLSDNSERVRLVKFGQTYEERGLHYLIITSEKNHRNLEKIRSDLDKLSDPRKISDRQEASRIIQSRPAVAWMVYAIHGDELSGADAALQLAYQLAAGEDSLTYQIRNELVVCIHPMENPDGRERYLSQMQQWNGHMKYDDVQSIQHTGVWPWGRGNHYLFDLNRDWILLVNRETRARVKEIHSWDPQLVVDAHEMGSLNTYLFSPPREPINPNFHENLKKWNHIFAKAQARAFDQYGWSYYTKEWNEQWYPGYGTSWPFLLGSVGILYEQAGTDGSEVKQRTGRSRTFRESVHHQFVSSVSNLETAAIHRQDLLQNYYNLKQEALKISNDNQAQTYYIVPGKNPSRARALIQKLLQQDIEIEQAISKFTVNGLHSYWNNRAVRRELPAGTYIVRLSQPLRPLIQAMLEFDPRMTTEFLREERRSLLKEKNTKLYEVSAWCLPMAFDLETYWSSENMNLSTRPLSQITEETQSVPDTSAAFGYLIDYADDKTVTALTRILAADLKARAARKPFSVEGRKFVRGSILLRVEENSEELAEFLRNLSTELSVKIEIVNTALSDSGPDLGGGEFSLLEKPRIALLTGPSISTTSFSALWYLLDRELKIKHSILNTNFFNRYDLRKYNVVVMPSSWGGSGVYQNMLGKSGIKKLKDWIDDGGTLVAIGNAAAFLADTANALSQVKLRRQNLEHLDMYQKLFEKEQQLARVKIDSPYVWEDAGSTGDTFKIKTLSSSQLTWMKQQDAQTRIFHPRGAILRTNLDTDHWLTFGLDEQLPVTVYTSYVYWAKDPVKIPVRFSEASQIRLSGLMWPEAKSRWAHSAYATVERKGRGQIILFAYDPYFRAYFEGSGRLLLNSLLLGPGMGASQSVPW